MFAVADTPPPKEPTLSELMEAASRLAREMTERANAGRLLLAFPEDRPDRTVADIAHPTAFDLDLAFVPLLDHRTR